MIRSGLAFLLLGIFLPSAIAQTPPPRDNSIANQIPLATGRITGRVTSAETGDPLRNARVSLTPSAGDRPLVLTDAEGRFGFDSLPPGSYAISAAKSGYASAASSVRKGTTRATEVQVD